MRVKTSIGLFMILGVLLRIGNLKAGRNLAEGGKKRL
jgi:hypothetical protein